MNAPRGQVLLTLLIVCGLSAGNLRAEQQTVRAQGLPPAAAGAASPEAALDTQLRVYKSALLEGKTDKIRLDAATLLLLSEDPAAREIVLDVLRRPDNPLARAAVCDALSPVRVGQKVLKNKNDFIKPLLTILTSEEDPEIAKRAAEATLLFGYSEVQQELERAVTDPSLSLNVRLNIIYALKRQPDKAAAAKLITLLDSTEPQIVDAARTALVSIGIAVGPDQPARQRLLAELRARSPEAFLRERMIRQETRGREMEAEISDWQKRYVKALSDLHDSLPTEAAKNQFLMQQLSAPEVVVRLWALDKLQELRNAKGTLKLPELEQTFLTLIQDSNRQVRLRTARLLARMGELNVAKALLDQLKAEPDDQVRRELLVALREACYVGSLATTGHKVPDEVRKETLDWAVRFLRDPDVEKVRAGAEAIGKLLEQDGLKPEEIDHYLKALLDRYAQAGPAGDPGMRASLLGAMAGLCAPRSTCRDQAVKLFSASFEQALADKLDPVRQNAVDGFVNIDKSAALRKLRENLLNDSNVIIRQKLVDLAGEVGGPQDLDWLAEKVGVAGEGDAWQAMLKIFRSPRSDLTVLANWAVRIEVLAETKKVTIEQRIAFFALVESKAVSENQPDLLKDVRTRLAQLYESSNNFKQASDYLKILLGAAAASEEKHRLEGQLVRVYLEMASMDQASELISKCLSDKNLDLSPNSLLVKSIEEYLTHPTTTDPGVVLESLRQIKVNDPEALRAWGDWLSRWSERFAKAKKLEDDSRISN